MKPSISAVAAAGTTALLFVGAWLLLFPVYTGNDDVAIRLFLEGRFVPGAEPSGYVFFVNLALGEAIASLYRLAPDIPWYDVVQQGTLLLTTFVALYCCIRFVRFWDDVAVVVLVAAMMLAVFAAIRFTMVGVLGATTGLTALVVAATSAKSKLERIALSAAGALLLLAGLFFRLEAALLGLFVIVLAGMHPIIVTLRTRGFYGGRSFWLISLAALIGAASGWLYHFAVYFGSPAWKDFYLFNFLRGQLTEYTAGYLPPEILNEAFAAVGWTGAEQEMLRQSVFFDTNVFSSQNMRLIMSKLPALPNTGMSGITNWLSTFGTQFYFFQFAAVGLLLHARRLGAALIAALSLAAILFVVLLISIFLKPLDYAVIWPVAAGSLLMFWIGFRLDRASATHWAQRGAAAILLVIASTQMVSETVKRSRADEGHHQQVLSDLTKLKIEPGKFVVTIGGAFPFQGTERPFAPPYLQRHFKVIPLGTILRAPPSSELMSRIALPDMPTWLCSDAVLIVSNNDPTLAALQSYYRRHHNRAASLTSVFKGGTFSLYHCSFAAS